MGSEHEDVNSLEGKTGKAAFLELYRLLPSAYAEDYFELGKWKDDDIKLDYELLQAHRKEAGAEEAPELSELPAPELPTASWGGSAAAAAAGVGGVPRIATNAVATGAGSRPASAGIKASIAAKPATPGAAMTPRQPKAAPPASLVSAGGAGGSIELRQIALFIQKWKLEPTKAKLKLAQLSPERRRYVMQNFQSVAGGMPSITQLETYISQCARTNAWPAVGGGAAATGGVKRVLSAGSFPAAKRPKAAGAFAAPTVLATRVGAATGGRPIFVARTQPSWLAGSAAARPFTPRPVMPRPVSPMARPLLGVAGALRPRPGVAMVRPGMMPRPGVAAFRPRPGAVAGFGPSAAFRPSAAFGFGKGIGKGTPRPGLISGLSRRM